MTIEDSIQIQNGAVEAFRSMADAAERFQGTLSAVKQASRNIVDAVELQKAREGFTQAQSAAVEYTQSVEQAKEVQKGLSQETRNSFQAVSKLAGRLKSAFDGGIEKAQKVMALSDEMAQTRARLGVVVDDGGSVDGLQQKLYQSAQRSRSDYMAVADVVTQMSLRAGDAFAGNDEAIRFAENLNKQFAIAGATQEETRSVSLQLAQALGTGAVNGEALNAMFKAAPNAVQTIAEHLGTSIEGVRKMAAEGQLSAETVKNAMLSATGSINQQFDAMPMTWGQVWTTMKNDALLAFEPVLQRVNDLANSQEFEQLRTSLSETVAELGNAALNAFTSLGSIAGFISENWSVLAPLIYGVTAAILAYKAGSLLAAAAQAIFNTALWSSPLTWIVLVVGLVVVAIAAWVESVGGLEMAWAICMDRLLLIWNTLQVAGMLLFDLFQSGLANLKIAIFTAVFWVQDRLSQMAVAFRTVGVSIANFMGDMKVNVLTILQNMINGAIGLINKFIGLINNIPGVSIDLIEKLTFGTEAAAQNEAEKQARNAALDEFAAAEESVRQGRADQLDHMQAQADAEHAKRWQDIQNATLQMLEDHRQRLEDMAAQTNKPEDPAQSITDRVITAPVENNFIPNAGEGSGAGAGLLGSGEQLAESRERLADSARNTGDTAENTARMADSLEASEEELKLIREIAERQAINKFTTAEVKIDMTGMTNKIESGEDIDGFLSQFTVKLEDALYATAEGVHV